MNNQQRIPVIFNLMTFIWLALIIATWGATWWISEEFFSLEIASTLIMVIAAFKTRLVLLYFMELKHAPITIRLIFEAWVVICLTAILAIYFGVI